MQTPMFACTYVYIFCTVGKLPVSNQLVSNVKHPVTYTHMDKNYCAVVKRKCWLVANVVKQTGVKLSSAK